MTPRGREGRWKLGKTPAEKDGGPIRRRLKRPQTRPISYTSAARDLANSNSLCSSQNARRRQRGEVFKTGTRRFLEKYGHTHLRYSREVVIADFHHGHNLSSWAQGHPVRYHGAFELRFVLGVITRKSTTCRSLFRFLPRRVVGRC